MKAQARLAAMRKTRSWLQKLNLAADAIPGTNYDDLIEEITDALRWCGGRIPAAPPAPKGVMDIRASGQHLLLQYGYFFADAINRGKSQLLRDLADCIDAYHAHEPQPDLLRQCVIAFCVPQNAPFKMRDILAHLRAQKVNAGKDPRAAVRRMCKELGLAIKGTAGRPPRKPGQKRV
jgi:hypothetical protein